MNFTVTIPGKASVPSLGQGTWHMGKNRLKRKEEADAIRFGLDLGMTLVDTAEMYHDAELVVGKAISGRRDDAFVVSKVLPSNGSLRGTISACERSLKRLGIECLDLYLLHWIGSIPVSQTLEAFVRLREQGKIAAFGVSNFDTPEMEDAWNDPGGESIATNQILYNLECRGAEWSLLPWCCQHQVPIMAYSPLNQGRLNFPALMEVATRHNATPAQIALAWLLHQQQVIVIPKSVDLTHIRENHMATKIVLSPEDLVEIDQLFSPPGCAHPLQML
jgi:diketogulonate reductase-like aldo/keto reductase